MKKSKRTTILVFAFLAAALLALAACDDDSPIPTQPQLPRVSVVTANYHLAIGS